MKRTRNSLLRGFNLILSSILALLGFESCGDVFNDDNLICEYGSPNATYVLKGKVTSPQGTAVEGERVIVRRLDKNGVINPYAYSKDTLYTDKQGEIQDRRVEFPTPRFRFVVEDPSGKYEKDSVEVEPKQVKKGDGGWYQGEYEVSAEIKLREKE